MPDGVSKEVFSHQEGCLRAFDPPRVRRSREGEGGRAGGVDGVLGGGSFSDEIAKWGTWSAGDGLSETLSPQAQRSRLVFHHHLRNRGGFLRSRWSGDFQRSDFGGQRRHLSEGAMIPVFPGKGRGRPKLQVRDQGRFPTKYHFDLVSFS